MSNSNILCPKLSSWSLSSAHLLATPPTVQPISVNGALPFSASEQKPWLLSCPISKSDRSHLDTVEYYTAVKKKHTANTSNNRMSLRSIMASEMPDARVPSVWSSLFFYSCINFSVGETPGNGIAGMKWAWAVKVLITGMWVGPGIFKKIAPVLCAYIHISIYYSLQIKKLWITQVKLLTQSYAFGNWLRQDINPVFLIVWLW